MKVSAVYLSQSPCGGIFSFFVQANIILIFCYLLVLFFSILICIGPILLTYVLPKEEWCGLTADYFTTDGTTNDNNRNLLSGDTETLSDSNSPYHNPDYILDPCRYLRVPYVFYITMEECDMCRRLLCSVLLGGIIG
jgi:hypothetical protein